ncbi:unnamed protein product [Symbiodinium natans]|uniref:Uncharacterized protein n=1 Tax=Symbiodinium natans TaxID=878477 RepID=A0A812R4Q3_9DINO|nr:unnamed protein product [Symbiodinium natans]
MIFCSTMLLATRILVPELSLGQAFSGCLCSPSYPFSFKCINVTRAAPGLYALVVLRSIVVLAVLEIAWYPVDSKAFLEWSALVFNYSFSRIVRASVACLLMATTGVGRAKAKGGGAVEA